MKTITVGHHFKTPTPERIPSKLKTFSCTWGRYMGAGTFDVIPDEALFLPLGTKR